MAEEPVQAGQEAEEEENPFARLAEGIDLLIGLARRAGRKIPDDVAEEGRRIAMDFTSRVGMPDFEPQDEESRREWMRKAAEWAGSLPEKAGQKMLAAVLSSLARAPQGAARRVMQLAALELGQALSEE